MATIPLSLLRRRPSATEPPPRRDFVLMCQGCKRPTTHMFESIVPIGIRMVDVIYECSRCGEHRPYGRETTDGKIADDSKDNDDDDRTAA